MKVLSYLSFLTFAISAAIGILSLVLDSRSASNRTMAASAFAYALWAGGMTFVYGASDQGIIQAFYRLSLLGSLLVIPCLLWHYLNIAGVPLRWKAPVLTLAFGFSVFLFVNFWLYGFYYGSFVDTPWGNRGVSPQNEFWSNLYPWASFAQFCIGLFALVRAHGTTPSQRLRHQTRVLIPALVTSWALYFGAWGAELVWGIPNAMVLAAIPLMLTNFWAVVRYRYLRKDTGLLEKHLAGVVQDSAFLLDAEGRILGANSGALERLGRAEAALVGTAFSDWLEDKALWDDDWTQTLEGKAPHRGRPCRLDGRTVYLSLTPRFDAFGDLVATVVLVGELDQFDRRATEHGLTPREREILLFILQGRDSQEIADALDISPGTVKRHIHNLCEKTVSANRVELMGRFLQ